MENFKANEKAIESLSENKRELALSLLGKVQFMEAELEKLQNIIKETGWTESYQNGANQFGKKKSSEAECYNALVKNYTSTIKTLTDLVPDINNEDPTEKRFFK